MNSGIYMIYCQETDKVYIGQSKNIKTRWKNHKSDLNIGRHGNIYLQRTYDKYGRDSIKFSVLEECNEHLSNREAFWLSKVDKSKRLNLKGVKDSIPTADETRLRQSLAQKGKTIPEEVRKKISETMKGKKKTPEHIKNAGDAQKGRVFSETHKAKIKESWIHRKERMKCH